MLRYKLIFPVVFVLLVVLSLPFSLVAQDDMEAMEEAHKQTLLRIIDEGFNQGNVEVIDELFAPDYVQDNAGVPGDREGFKFFIAALHDAMPDYEASVDLMVAEGDWLAFRFKDSGTFENEFALFPGLPPTGETVEELYHIFIRFNEDGQLVEEWDLGDNMTWLTQLGVLPPPEG